MPIEPWMFTSYSQTPTGGNPGLLLGAGQLREQRRHSLVGEGLAQSQFEFDQYQEQIRQQERQQVLQQKALEDLQAAWASGDEAQIELRAYQLEQFGGEINPGSVTPGLQGEPPPPAQAGATVETVQPGAAGALAQAATEPDMPQAEFDAKVEAQRPMTPDEGGKLLTDMQAAQAKATAEQTAKGEQSKRAAALVAQARQSDQAGKPDVATKAYEEALRLFPDPRGHLEAATRYAKAGDAPAARRHFEAAATADVTEGGDPEAYEAKAAATAELQRMDTPPVTPADGPMAMRPARQPRAQGMLKDGFTVRVGGRTMTVTPEMGLAARQRKFGSLWEPIKQTAFHPVLRQMAEESQKIGHSLIAAGVTPKEAFELTNQQYNERSRVWAGIKAAEAQAYQKSKMQGDKLADERWDRKSKFQNQVSDNLRLPKMQEGMSAMKTAQTLYNKGDANSRAAAWNMIVDFSQRGIATDADFARVANAGGALEKLKAMTGRVTGTPTDQQVAEANGILNNIIGQTRSYMRSAVASQMRMYRNDSSNRQLHGGDLDADVHDMTFALLGDEMPQRARRSPRRTGGGGPQPATQTSESTSTSSRSAGPMDSDLDALAP